MELEKVLLLHNNIQFTSVIVKFLSNPNYHSPLLSYHHIAFKYGSSSENCANSRSLTPSRETSSVIDLHQWCPTTLPCLFSLFNNTFNPFKEKIDGNVHKPNVLSIFVSLERMNEYVLQFLLHHEEEYSCSRTFKSSFLDIIQKYELYPRKDWILFKLLRSKLKFNSISQNLLVRWGFLPLIYCKLVLSLVDVRLSNTFPHTETCISHVWD